MPWTNPPHLSHHPPYHRSGAPWVWLADLPQRNKLHIIHLIHTNPSPNPSLNLVMIQMMILSIDPLHLHHHHPCIIIIMMLGEALGQLALCRPLGLQFPLVRVSPLALCWMMDCHFSLQDLMYSWMSRLSSMDFLTPPESS